MLQEEKGHVRSIAWLGLLLDKLPDCLTQLISKPKNPGKMRNGRVGEDVREREVLQRSRGVHRIELAHVLTESSRDVHLLPNALRLCGSQETVELVAKLPLVF
jgi:hypothetical protein